MRLNDIVIIHGELAVVTELIPHGRETLGHCHYIDIHTGKKMVCPDKRCHGEHTCPIHGTNVVYAPLLSAHDLDYYTKQGMISKDLAKAAKKGA